MEIWMGIAHGLAYVILGGLGWWLASIHGRVGKVEDKQTSLELNMATYQGDIRVANERLSSIQDSLHGHMEREEHEAWVKIDSLGNEMSEMRINMATMVAELKNIGASTRDALRLVLDHNKEADDWKRRIAVIETEIKRFHGTK